VISVPERYRQTDKPTDGRTTYCGIIMVEKAT